MQTHKMSIGSRCLVEKLGDRYIPPESRYLYSWADPTLDAVSAEDHELAECTFQPTMSTRSRSLAGEDRKWQVLYEDMQRKHRKRQELSAHYDRETMAHCTFKPSQSNFARNKEGILNTRGTFEEHFRHPTKKGEQMKRLIAKRREARDREELAQCTFKPAMSEVVEKHYKARQETHRLYESLKKAKEKMLQGATEGPDSVEVGVKSKPSPTGKAEYIQITKVSR